MNRAAFLRLLVAAPLAGWPPLRAGGSQLSPRSRAIQWLVSMQSADGAWRSSTYGAFRDGRALTPLVLRALAGDAEAAEVCRKAAEWITGQGAAILEEYPVHHAAAILEAAPLCPGLAVPAVFARRKLQELQCPRTGGWSYSTVAPPATGELAPMQQANLAATTMAVDGLKSAKLEDAALFSCALAFVKSCQNFGIGETTFDDGGFFQMPDDPARNKAGQAGKDNRGVMCYLSYASATADGLRAILHCGESADSPRVKAAVKWLEKFRWGAVGGKNAPADLCYYTARSLKVTSKLCPAVKSVPEDALVAAREEDGSWKNRAGEMREDCPIVATALAVEALPA
ncbi:hypothetical protein [Haloferula sp. BvORR071]|uniref:hypothetical protein n=1 Tax=Haloferula sp. BvORR071 TaxID=1396141 RepID=UPI000552D4FC|nr:hypothetical protein [Haloferula sp. BvORR071]